MNSNGKCMGTGVSTANKHPPHVFCDGEIMNETYILHRLDSIDEKIAMIFALFKEDLLMDDIAAVISAASDVVQALIMLGGGILFVMKFIQKARIKRRERKQMNRPRGENVETIEV